MNLASQNPIVNPGIATKLGIGIQPSGLPNQAVIASRLLTFTKFDGSSKGGAKRTPRETLTGFPGYLNTTKGEAEYQLDLSMESTPEGASELLSTYFGAPVTSAAAVPAAPGTPTATVNGTPGVANYYYEIVAVSPQGDSAASGVRHVTTGNAVLSSVNSITLNWAAVQGATLYKILKSPDGVTYNLVGETQWLSIVDTGLSGSAYVAPAGPTGNQQIWNTNIGGLYATLQAFYGENYDTTNLIGIWAGVRGDKLTVKWTKKGGKALMFDCNLRALYNTWGFSTLASVGLDVATLDLLNAFAESYAVAMIGGETCSCNDISLSVDRSLWDKHELNGYAGAVCMGQGRNKISWDATLSFDSDKQMRRYFGAVATSGTFSETLNLPTYPIQAIVANPINGGGIVNQFGAYASMATLDTVGPAIEGPDEIMQKVKLTPYVDINGTGTDLLLSMVNSQSNGAIITPETLISTSFNGGAINPYSV